MTQYLLFWSVPHYIQKKTPHRLRNQLQETEKGCFQKNNDIVNVQRHHRCIPNVEERIGWQDNHRKKRGGDVVSRNSYTTVQAKNTSALPSRQPLQLSKWTCAIPLILVQQECLQASPHIFQAVSITTTPQLVTTYFCPNLSKTVVHTAHKLIL